MSAHDAVHKYISLCQALVNNVGGGSNRRSRIYNSPICYNCKHFSCVYVSIIMSIYSIGQKQRNGAFLSACLTSIHIFCIIMQACAAPVVV